MSSPCHSLISMATFMLLVKLGLSSGQASYLTTTANRCSCRSMVNGNGTSVCNGGPRTQAEILDHFDAYVQPGNGS